jgi:hypothetical protein
MSTVVESTRGHYERKEEPCGESYVWCPECVVVECGCGVRAALTPSQTVCRCGADTPPWSQRNRPPIGCRTPHYIPGGTSTGNGGRSRTITCDRSPTTGGS